MLVKYGERNITNPSEDDYQIEGEEHFSGGRVAFLSSEKVVAGNWIKVYLKIKKGLNVAFSATPKIGNDHHVSLGNSVYDMT